MGRVLYYVRATLRDNAAVQEAAAQLEIRPGDHLFAIVDAWTVDDVQEGIGSNDHESEWAKDAGVALYKARMISKPEDIELSLIHI